MISKTWENMQEAILLPLPKTTLEKRKKFAQLPIPGGSSPPRDVKEGRQACLLFHTPRPPQKEFTSQSKVARATADAAAAAWLVVWLTLSFLMAQDHWPGVIKTTTYRYPRQPDLGSSSIEVFLSGDAGVWQVDIYN